MTMTLPLMITDQSNPQNENLNLLVEIKFLNLFFLVLKKTEKFTKFYWSWAVIQLQNLCSCITKKTKYYL